MAAHIGEIAYTCGFSAGEPTMIVKFISSETGEMVMMSDMARPLLKAIGKSCQAEGVITKSEMLLAVAALERYLDAVAPQESRLSEEEEKATPAINRPVSIRQRAWPFIKMLNRTAQSGKDSHIVWKAAGDFGTEAKS
jgi:hypothetical protein